MKKLICTIMNLKNITSCLIATVFLLVGCVLTCGRPPLSQSFLFLATKNCRVARKNNITPMAFSAVTIQNVAA